MTRERLYYSYFYLREDFTVYYVGKGFGNRAFEEHGGFKPPKDKKRIIIQVHPSECEAFEAEIFFISFFGRKDLGTGCLRNHTDGGEGTSGYKHTEEAKRKIAMTSSERINAPLRRDAWRSYGKNNRGKERPDAAQYLKDWMDSLTPKQRSEHGKQSRSAVKNLHVPHLNHKSPSTETRQKIASTVSIKWEEMSEEEYTLRCKAISEGIKKNPASLVSRGEMNSIRMKQWAKEHPEHYSEAGKLGGKSGWTAERRASQAEIARKRFSKENYNAAT